MRSAALTFVLFTVAVASAAAQAHYGSTDVKAFREGRDAEFRDRARSPLTDSGFSSFAGLDYFEVSEKFVVTAALDRNAGERRFLMPTSDGLSRAYVRYGVLRFEIDGSKHSLTVFEPETKSKVAEYADLLFVPFRDLTNGKESYGGGRYLDIRPPTGDTVVLNFNLAYNPSCAYGSDRYSCALPPRENFLQAKIFAGERNFVIPDVK
jgi:hypothetical protein